MDSRTSKVIWETKVEAGTHEEAAREALTIQRDPLSTAKVFTVTEEGGNTRVVDLSG